MPPKETPELGHVHYPSYQEREVICQLVPFADLTPEELSLDHNELTCTACKALIEWMNKNRRNMPPEIARKLRALGMGEPVNVLAHRGLTIPWGEG